MMTSFECRTASSAIHHHLQFAGSEMKTFTGWWHLIGHNLVKIRDNLIKFWNIACV